jgi:transposase
MDSIAVVAMDIHKKFSKAMLMDEGARVVGEHDIKHGDPAEMRKFLSIFEVGTHVVMEATFNWPWIADLATGAGLRVHLVDPMRAREMARGYSKSDRKDAIYLGKLFLSAQVFPEVYLAPGEVRDKRYLFRQRALLVRMRTAAKNAVHGQLFRLGYVTDEEVSDLFGVSGRQYLRSLELKDTERLLLDEKLKVIDGLNGHLGFLESRIADDLREDERADVVMSIPGVGKLVGYAVLAEIGQIERFPSPRALSAYAGLLPLENQSAEKHMPKHTGQRFNRWLRWAAIEAVTGAVRSSGRMKSLYTRVKLRNRGMPGKARVAVAREILELAWLLLTRKERYQETPPGRPGSKDTRPSNPNRASQTTLCARS